MYPTSGQSNPGPQTHSAQLREDTTGEVFRSLEDSLEEAVDLVMKTNGTSRSEAAAERLDTAFEAAERILAKAASIRPSRT